MRSSLTRVAIRFAYDGSSFDSFARQPARRTVEGELLAGLQRAGVIKDARAADYKVASRTDRGVSAWGNVCAISTDVDIRGLVHSLDVPDGLWVLAAAPVDDAFSPRAEAIERTYRYHLLDADELDWRAMRGAAQMFAGLHDFRNFCRREPGVTTRRRIGSVVVQKDAGRGFIRFVAPNFLWEQVRRMVHAILDVGTGRRDADAIARQLGSGGKIEPPAAPEPLVLEHVEVPVDFPSPSKKSVTRIQVARRGAEARARFYSGLASSLPTTRR